MKFTFSMLQLNNIYQGDCLELMIDIPDKSIDAIICDLPYGVLNKGNASTKWDCVIPFEPLWEQYNRIIKDNGAIILFAQGMFTAQLMMSNPKMWRYNLIWDKMRVTAFLNANRMPMRCHEDICIFYKSLPTYNPQMEIGLPNHPTGNGKHKQTNNCYGKYKEMGHRYAYQAMHNGFTRSEPTNKENEKFPQSIIRIQKEHESTVLHPTQKPVALLRYLIRTYTNEGDVVLDNCMGSGSTCIAAIKEKRHYIGIEKDEQFFAIAQKRINIELMQPTLF